MSAKTAPVYEIVDAATLRQRLADADWLEAPVTDGVSPLVIVDLDASGGDTLGGHKFDEVASATTPRVFVAMGGRGTIAREAFDVAIDNDGDGARAILELADTCRAAPRAVVVATQLLRTAETGTVAEGLWRESVAYSMLLAGPEFGAWRRRRRRARADGDRDNAFPITVDDRGDVVEIALDRPQVHNAYNAAMRDALVAVLRSLIAAKPPPTLLLRGNGPSFCSGGDLDEFGTTPDVVDAHSIRTSRAPAPLLAAFGARATAVVHGACIGAGTELAAFCGRVEAAPDTRFQLPELAMGLVPGAGGTVSVSRRIGRQRCALLALTGRTIDAPTALEWGLIDAVVPQTVD